MEAPQRFRKVPVEVEAILWTGHNRDAVAVFIGDRDVFELDGEGRALVAIPTLEGVMVAEPGCWLIRGVEGEVYPCRGEIFTATYEAAGSQP